MLDLLGELTFDSEVADFELVLDLLGELTFDPEVADFGLVLDLLEELSLDEDDDDLELLEELLLLGAFVVEGLGDDTLLMNYLTQVDLAKYRFRPGCRRSSQVNNKFPMLPVCVVLSAY